MPPALRLCHYYGRTDADHGGVARAVVDSSMILARMGHHITILATRTPELLAAQPDRKALAIVELSARRLPGRLLRRSDLKRALASIEQSDVIHLHEVWDPACLQLARRARRMGRAVVISPHGSLGEKAMRRKRLKKRLFLRLGGRRMLERASVIHCLTEAEAAASRRWCPRARFAVVPLLMDLSGFEHDPGTDAAHRVLAGLRDDRPNLLFLGRLDPHKGPDILIDAVSRLHAEGIDCNTVIAGKGESGYVESLRMRAEEGGVASLVRLPGFVAGIEKVALLHWADLFVLPTHHDVWGIALHEALAAGTPIVTTADVEVRSELEATGGATIVAGNGEALAAAVRALIQDRAALERRGMAAGSSIRETHRSDRVAHDYVRFYSGLAASTPSVGSGVS